MFIFALIAVFIMYSLFRKRRIHNSLRYPGRDYSRPGKYFVTICTENKTEWFGEIVNDEMQLSDIGSIALKMWHEIPAHFPYITLDEYVIMPDHIHGIIIINKYDKNPVVGSLHATNLPKNETMSSISPQPGSLSVIVRSYKSAVTRNARLVNNDFSWQSRFYDSIICTTRQLSRIRKYIKNNPVDWARKRSVACNAPFKLPR